MSGAENPPAPAPDGWRRWARVGEDSLVTLALGALGGSQHRVSFADTRRVAEINL